MIYVPRPWQKPMTSFVLGQRRCNLWADMGAGKTSAILTALEVLRFTNSSFFPVLVLAPKRVARGVWPDEIRNFEHLQHLRVSPIVGDADARLRALKVGADVYTMNYENLPWLCDKAFPFRTVIADESTRLKNFRLRNGGVRAHALSHVARKTDRWVNLTGTPTPNGLKDLWGQQWFVDFGQRLGNTYTAFMDRWFATNQYTMEVAPKEFAESQIITALKDCTLSIQLKDWMDIKEPVVNYVDVELPAKCVKQYKELEKEMFTRINEHIEIDAQTAAALSTKCLQFAAGAVYYGENGAYTVVHDEKLDALESVIEETSGANLCVFYWWKHDKDRILKRFKNARVIHNKKDEDDWNAGKIELGLLHPQSAGHGLNLQHGGHHICHFSRWWSLEANQQANERLGPIRQMQSGYDRLVYHHLIRVKGTIDMLVDTRLKGKASVQQLLKDAMKGGIESCLT